MTSAVGSQMPACGEWISVLSWNVVPWLKPGNFSPYGDVFQGHLCAVVAAGCYRWSVKTIRSFSEESSDYSHDF